MTRTTRSSGGDACYYDNEKCEGETWECGTCGETFCTTHSHATEKGHNVECVACERERLDAKLLAEPDGVEHAVRQTDVLKKLDIADKS